MRPLLVSKNYLMTRVGVSLVLQTLLVVLLRWPSSNSLLFSLAMVLIALVALLELRLDERWLNPRLTLMLHLLSLFPQIAFLATLLHLLGTDSLFNWVRSICFSV